MHKASERGFTVLELLIVIVVLALFVGASVFFLRPASYEAAEQDAERQLGLAAMGQALQRYKKAEGGWPKGLPSKDTPISSFEDGYDLCLDIIPDYLRLMPLDPANGIQYTGSPEAGNMEFTDDKPCTDHDITYASGFSIRQDKDGAITLSALSSKRQRMDVVVR